MFGPAFLVNPVTEPMYFTAGSQVIEAAPRTRPIYLPIGSDWYDFWTGQRYAGGQTLDADAVLEVRLSTLFDLHKCFLMGMGPNDFN